MQLCKLLKGWEKHLANIPQVVMVNVFFIKMLFIPCIRCKPLFLSTAWPMVDNKLRLFPIFLILSSISPMKFECTLVTGEVRTNNCTNFRLTLLGMHIMVSIIQ